MAVLLFVSHVCAVSAGEPWRPWAWPGAVTDEQETPSTQREAAADSLPHIKTPLFLTLKLSNGGAFKTNDFVRGSGVIKTYLTTSLKFGISSVGNRWQDIAYGMPYYGIALYGADFGSQKNFGNPVSVYLLQGAEMLRISRSLSLNYEWNLGISMGWKSYDPFKNDENVAIGTDVNAHVGLGFYLKWYVNRWLDLHLGADLAHFSNGAQKMPNKGMNMYSVFVEAAFNFNRPEVREKYDPTLVPPKYDKHLVSDIYATISSCRIEIDTTGTNMPSEYLDHKFKVLGLNYSLMRAPNYRYRYGVGVDVVYNESAGATAERKYNPKDGKWYNVVYYGRGRDRLSVGINAKGEVVLPGYSIFANMGWQIYKGNKKEQNLYQILGVKVYLKDNFFGTFGIRANHFSKAQYLFWSLGYTIDHHRRR